MRVAGFQINAGEQPPRRSANQFLKSGLVAGLALCDERFIGLAIHAVVTGLDDDAVNSARKKSGAVR
jgi:hypothetical protein